MNLFSPYSCRIETPQLTLPELRVLLEQMGNLPCAMHQIGDVKVKREFLAFWLRTDTTELGGPISIFNSFITI